MNRKWRRKHGYWYLIQQGRKLAEVFEVPKGWVVCIVQSGTFAGPYGDFNVARHSAEERTCR
jgi:hypothetical protein